MMFWTVAGNLTRGAWELPHGPYTSGPRLCPRRDEHDIPRECEDSGPWYLKPTESERLQDELEPII